jgi:hypothetical protein
MFNICCEVDQVTIILRFYDYANVSEVFLSFSNKVIPRLTSDLASEFFG